MTTYTLTGLAAYRDPATDDTVGVDSTNVTLELVVADATTSLRYTANPLPPGGQPGDETVNITVKGYTLRINGMTVGAGTPVDPEFSIYDLTWKDAANVTHVSTILVPFLENIPVQGLGTVDADYVFVINGDPLPAINTVADWNNTNDRIVSLTIPTGAYGPNKAIALTSLGATVGENDLITGTGGKNTFDGGVGNDAIHGLAGNDTLRGSAGNDLLDGGKGADKLIGGAGKDTASYASANIGVKVDLARPGKNTGEATGDTFTSIENLIGSAHRDILRGNSAGNRIDGGKDNDTLLGQGGKDMLRGAAGKDTLNGGAGNDKMTGGQGFDTFIFSGGKDVITDFNTTSNKEDIDLSGVAAITGFRDLKANHVTETGGNLVIDDGSGNTLTLNGLAIADIDKGDFIF